MKKMFIFFIIHFFIIFTLSIYLFIDSIFEDREIPPLSFLKSYVYGSTEMRHYLVFSGINTGYGFYGVNVATNKFFLVELLDSDNKIVKTLNVSDFSTNNSFSRFSTLPSWIYNFNVETNELTNKGEHEVKRYCELREKFIYKVYNYIGKEYASKYPHIKKYNVKLITVVPPNIWEERLEKNNVYVLQKFEFNSK